jgi:DtxR family Mn-dependent transcriptional regulator
MPKENVDEYLEAILDLAGEDGKAKTGDIAARLNITPASVTEVMQRLDREGLVAYEAYRGVSLTRRGLSRAHSVKRKHRLLEVFLSKVLRIDGKKVHEEACKMEHAISDETEEAICRLLGGPKECPHGSPIPECASKSEDCDACISEGRTVPLTTLKPGRKALIATIKGGRAVVERLSDLGLTPGTMVTLVRAAPLKGPVEVCARCCNLAIGRGIAEKILVVPQEG